MITNPDSRKARLRRAFERRDAGARRVKRVWIDTKGFTWEGRIREHDLIGELYPIVTIAVAGPLELPSQAQRRATLRLDINKYVAAFPLSAAPMPWTQPRGKKPIPGVEWTPAIGVIDKALFRAGHALAQIVAQEEPPTYQTDAQLKLLDKGYVFRPTKVE